MINKMRINLIELLCEKEGIIKDHLTCNGRLNKLCISRKCCSIKNLNQKQIEYIETSSKQNLYLKACPGSGKTEVLSLKISHEVKTWEERYKGMAILTFTNSAEKEIEERISMFLGRPLSYPHYVGTFTSWVHGYIANPFSYHLKYHNKNEEGNNIKVIDGDTESGFMNTFATKLALGKLGKVKANQYYYRNDGDERVVTLNDSKNQNLLNKMLKDDKWRNQELAKTKGSFWSNGFYTYEDIEHLAYILLRDNLSIAKMVSDRFPMIFIDECQDLSVDQLAIIDTLKKAGSCIHLIGDLDQSIYGFRYVEPNKILNYITKSKFNTKTLDINYRSCQEIVDLCEDVVKGNKEIIGYEKTIMKEPLIAFLYGKDKEIVAIDKFKSLIDEQDLISENCMVIVRNKNLKNKIMGYGHSNYNRIESYAVAIYLAINYKNIDEYKESINLLSWAIQRTYFDDVESGNKLGLYCPANIESKVWRISLGQILNMLLMDKELNNLELTWKQFREKLLMRLKEISDKFDILKGRTCNIGRLRNNIGEELLKNTLMINNNISPSSLKISTIHAVKGLSLDAILVMSTYANTGENKDSGSHWKQWFNNETVSEKNRLAYVAFSRAKYLLGVAIPKPKNFSKQDKEKLKSLGFTIVDCS